ncbi:hypothetical protein LWP59_16030 [Amycolatopsis acidiphila]|uniref:Uncharacterized protein n=1 Tax=Amycolatopsis acidiphila TaxID=715473 RepID=A0A557ZXV8_9PSEU|nr:hypothetical protein [Amycolatopsis acidiphila]TVT16824.1 hypothetical protein FNH06_33770 [Amycolatopsis acidiphila]UIJ63025.1 hypothetical protein LWP59_16030 [Amycolatopsis acidiphila]GHG65715.1 hypothetical protein GCM10017788_23380 [Amycolatopsis acidiphila]
MSPLSVALPDDPAAAGAHRAVLAGVPARLRVAESPAADIRGCPATRPAGSSGPAISARPQAVRLSWPSSEVDP